MVLEHPLRPFFDWFPGALTGFLVLSLFIAIAVLLGGYLFSAARLGPGAAMRRIGRTLRDAWRDFRQLSFRRVGAIAKLTIRESTRRYVVVVFVVFLIILLFAAWYLDTESDNPGRLYLSFVLNTTNLLVFALALFLSAFSIPNDIKSRTIYTVVTKPIRPWEIVLGRIAGFAAVCTVILALMCLASYIFVLRGLQHTHTVDVLELQRRGTGENAVMIGDTSRTSNHRHELRLNQDGLGETDSRMGHIHYVERVSDDEIRVGAAQHDSLQARRPYYGVLQFLDRQGRPTRSGINPGKEWGYRGYIEGQTGSAAIWRFSGIDGRDFPEGIPLEMTIRVFRTHKGDIEKGIVGSLSLHNPLFAGGPPADASAVNDETAVRSQVFQLVANEFSTNSIFIPRRITAQMPDNTTAEVDVFNSLVHDGQLDIKLQCDEPAQYYGVAGPDLYIRAAESWFAWNFVKTYYSIWLQLLVVISLGVMFSTVMSGAVAMLGTFFCVALGFYARTIVDVATGQLEGGGPLEALFRLVRQQNVVEPMEEGATTVVIQSLDQVVMNVMSAAAGIMPNFRGFAEYGGMNTVGFVASGFNIPMNLIAQHSLMCFAYVAVVSCLGYAFLKTREIAA